MEGTGSCRLIIFGRPAEEPFNSKPAFGPKIRQGQQIYRTSYIAHRLNAARILHIIPTPLQIWHPAGRAEERRQMSTRGHSPNADPLGTEIVLRRVRDRKSTRLNSSHG